MIEEWRKRAACLDRYDEIFDNDEHAKTICKRCPVKAKCLAYALDHDIQYDVWGGRDFEERTRLCPVCRGPKEPSPLGCSAAHSLARLARLIELERAGDTSISVTHRSQATAITTPGCPVPRGRSHSSGKAYREGCRCAASLKALREERRSRPKPKPYVPRSPQERFLSMVEIDADGHWWWRGSTNGSGYGNFWDGRKVVRAHIFAYELFVGPLPEQAVLRPVDEIASPRCVNPDHHQLIGV